MDIEARIGHYKRRIKPPSVSFLWEAHVAGRERVQVPECWEGARGRCRDRLLSGTLAVLRSSCADSLTLWFYYRLLPLVGLKRRK